MWSDAGMEDCMNYKSKTEDVSLGIWGACEETIRSRAEGSEETRFVLNQLSVEEELEEMKLSHGREFE